MKETITAGCGHTTVMQLFGPSKERERKVQWLKSPDGKCNACYAAMKAGQEAKAEQADIERWVAQLRAALATDTSGNAREQLEAAIGNPRFAGTPRLAAMKIILAELS